jgi:hypothetical protein
VRHPVDASTFCGAVSLNSKLIAPDSTKASPKPNPNHLDGSIGKGRSKGTRAEVAGGEAFSATATALPKGVVPIEFATSASATRQRYGPAGRALSLRHNPGEARRPRTSVPARRRYKYLPRPPPSPPTHLPCQTHTDSQTHCVRPPLQRSPSLGLIPRRGARPAGSIDRSVPMGA